MSSIASLLLTAAESKFERPILPQQHHMLPLHIHSISKSQIPPPPVKTNRHTRVDHILSLTALLSFTCLCLVLFSDIRARNNSNLSNEDLPSSFYLDSVEISGFVLVEPTRRKLDFNHLLLGDSIKSFFNSVESILSPIPAASDSLSFLLDYLIPSTTSKLIYSLDLDFPTSQATIHLESLRGTGTFRVIKSQEDSKVVSYVVRASHKNSPEILNVKVVSWKNGADVGLKIWIPVEAEDTLTFQIDIIVPDDVNFDVQAAGFVKVEEIESN